jgi:nucleoside-diphosphate-sugar epimerase
MKILLTGATGVVGKNLIKALSAYHNDITVLTRSDFSFKGINTISTLNTNWKDQVKIADPEVVIHLASYLTSSDDEQSINQLVESNLLFGVHLLDALKGGRLKVFINTGTFAEYRNNELSPAYLYAATKTAFRSIIKYYQNIQGFKVVNVIPYTIYGGADTRKKLIDHIYQSSTSIQPVKMSPGEQVLDFIHINDVTNFFVRLLASIDKVSSNYLDVHLGTGIGTTPKALTEIIENIGYPTNILWGGIPYRTADTMHSVAPASPLFDIINWKPEIQLEQGVNLYIQSLTTE